MLKVSRHPSTEIKTEHEMSLRRGTLPPPPTILFIPFIYTSLGLSFYLSTCLLDLFFIPCFLYVNFMRETSFDKNYFITQRAEMLFYKIV